MNETQLAGRTMLKVTGIVLIILSALGLLGGLALIGAGLAMGTDDGLGWGVVTALITLGVLAVPRSALWPASWAQNGAPGRTRPGCSLFWAWCSSCWRR